MAGIAQRWRELSGENNWEGLLDPLDIDLRRYIIHYGERTEAVANAFNEESRFSRYPPNNFFSKVGVQCGNPFKYTVTNFFYARADIINFGPWLRIGESSWMGYVAVATEEGKAVLGRRDILICLRGTMTGSERFNDLIAFPESASDIFGANPHHDAKVHKGFHSIYTAKDDSSAYNKKSLREQILNEVRKQVDKYKDEEISITVTGHSLGGALATLTGVDIVSNGYNKPSNDQQGKACLVTVMAFASPRVGNKHFKEAVSQFKQLHVLCIINLHDGVPDLPPRWSSYADLKPQLVIDTTKSPYLLKLCPAGLHNLEVYLHGVAGTQGTKEFKLVIDRCRSLVNKSLDALNPKLTPNVPKNWWVVKNKGMVQKDDGCWELEDYVPDPTPSIIPL